MKIEIIFVTGLLFLLVQYGVVYAVTANDNNSTQFKDIKDYRHVETWGGAGSGDGQFLRPHDLDFSPDEKVLYAVDRDGNRIQAFDKDGKFLYTFGEEGTDDGQMFTPYGIDVDIKGNIWLADRANDRVQKFDPKGEFILKFGNEDGKPSEEEGLFDNPRHVAVSKDLKYVYVADSKNDRISIFDINGKYIKSVGHLGAKQGEFNLPTTIEIDSKGNFIINERGNERIQKFDKDWKPLAMWGNKGSGNYQFCHIEHIALDKYDNIYVTDPQSDPGCSQQPRVLKFDSGGNFITKWGSYGKGDGQFQDPEHLAVDSEGNVYVSDRKRDDIQKFEPVVVLKQNATLKFISKDDDDEEEDEGDQGSDQYYEEQLTPEKTWEEYGFVRCFHEPTGTYNTYPENTECDVPSEKQDGDGIEPLEEGKGDDKEEEGNEMYRPQYQFLTLDAMASSTDEMEIYDQNLMIELVASGLDFPTTMDFLGKDDFLVLEKNGIVKRVVGGKVLPEPVLTVKISSNDERGMLGIAINDNKKDVFLYYVTCKTKTECFNQVYKYQFDGSKLVNPVLLLSVPSFPDKSHVGGILDIDKDGNIYATIGNFQDTIPSIPHLTPAQNFEDEKPLDGRAGILRITQSGDPVGGGLLGDKYPLNLYYAYGIKNSFGIDFDSITGKLWDTENGPQYGDEVNLVEAGFNSGADKVYGIWDAEQVGGEIQNIKVNNKKGDDENNKVTTIQENNVKGLVNLGGKGKYSNPEFTWGKTVAPTALEFYESDKLGVKYKDGMFVGTADGGRIFFFQLETNRTSLKLTGDLDDKLAMDKKEFTDILFAEGFTIITDIKEDKYDGYLYVVAGLKEPKSKEKAGAVFRIVPK